MIAQEFAIAYPDRVNRLVLGCTACGGPKSIPAAPPVLQTLMARANMTPKKACARWFPTFTIVDAARTHRGRSRDSLCALFPRPLDTSDKSGAISKWSCYDRLGKIAAPTLVIHGETDELVPPENGKILAAQIPGAEAGDAREREPSFHDRPGPRNRTQRSSGG
jgi:pimeloyl-ACP methyl ester carboxylesterase